MREGEVRDSCLFPLSVGMQASEREGHAQREARDVREYLHALAYPRRQTDRKTCTQGETGTLGGHIVGRARETSWIHECACVYHSRTAALVR